MEMIVQDIPYFMTNENWYYYDYEKLKYMLTDRAPQKAVRSYKEFYNMLDND